MYALNCIWSTNQSSEFLLFSCIVYFVYFTNYFRVCIFVYLLTINFVCVLIVYFQNIVYLCITINFTLSYLKIAHIYYIPCTCNYRINFCYIMNLHVPVLFIPHVYFKCKYRLQMKYHIRSVTKIFKRGGRAKFGHENSVNNRYNL